jgi:hypothetical protein
MGVVSKHHLCLDIQDPKIGLLWQSIAVLKDVIDANHRVWIKCEIAKNGSHTPSSVMIGTFIIIQDSRYKGFRHAPFQ